MSAFLVDRERAKGISRDGVYTVRGMPHAYASELVEGSQVFDVRGAHRQVLCDERVSIIKFAARGRVLCATSDGLRFWTYRMNLHRVSA